MLSALKLPHADDLTKSLLMVSPCFCLALHDCCVLSVGPSLAALIQKGRGNAGGSSTHYINSASEPPFEGSPLSSSAPWWSPAHAGGILEVVKDPMRYFLQLLICRVPGAFETFYL